MSILTTHTIGPLTDSVFVQVFVRDVSQNPDRLLKDSVLQACDFAAGMSMCS